MLVLAAVTVSAQDDEAPEVAGPADRPGADVLWEQNVEYTLDATGSTDNVGIVLYTWNITDEDGSVQQVTSTTPTAKWTPTAFGVYQIVTMAEDAHGNKGYHLYTMDVAEVISGQTFSNMDITYDHSVVVSSGTLKYQNTNIEVTGGMAAQAPATVDAPDLLAENVVNKGKYAGRWGPYYTLNYGDNGIDQYGLIYEDSTTKLSGSKSIKVANGLYYYGFEYIFDDPADLSKFNALSFWLHTDYVQANDDYYYMYYMYFYGNEQYSTPMAYTYSGCMYSGGTSIYKDWQGYTVNLDYEKNGYTYMYGMSDFSSITILRFYIYYIRNMYGGSSYWIDNVGFYNANYGDEITESATPSGPKSGRWYTSLGTITDTSDSYVGNAAVGCKVQYQAWNDIYYYFDTPQDLSEFNALRMQLNMKTDTGTQINYCYYWPYTGYYMLYVYDSNGRVAYYKNYRYSYTYYAYGDQNGGHWFGKSLPWGKKTAYYDNGCDFTQVSYFRFANIYYSYSYPSSTYAYIYIDALDWFKPGGPAGGSGPPVNTETIPHGIYVSGGGTLEMSGVYFKGDSDFGAFVRCEANLRMSSTTLENLWGTTHPSIKNEGNTYGGILAFDSTVDLDDVTIVGAASSGIYTENCDFTANNLDISGHSKDFALSAGVIVAFSGTGTSGLSSSGTEGVTDLGADQDYNVEITRSDFYDSPQGSGLMILSHNARGEATINLTDVAAYKNAVYGIVLEVTGWTGNLTMKVEDCEFELNDGSGFAFNAFDAMYTPKTMILFNVTNCDFSENGQYGLLVAVSKSVLRTMGRFTDIETFDNTGNGAGFDVNGFDGAMNIFFENLYSHDNLGDGMYIKYLNSQFRDITGVNRYAVGRLTVDMETCTFSANERNGVQERHRASGSYNDAIHPTNDYRLIARNVTCEKNEGSGYSVNADGQSQYGNRYGNYEFYNSHFTDNKLYGFYVYDYYYNYYYYGNIGEEVFEFYNCSFTYNQRGFAQYWEQACYGMRTWVRMRGCILQDNDYEALYAWGYWYTYYDSGMSYLEYAEYDIQDSLIDDEVHLDVSGAYDANQYIPSIVYKFINNTYTGSEPMYLRASCYMYSYSYPMEAVVIYKDMIHTSPSIGDGVHFELYGGGILSGRVEIENVDIRDSLGNGVFVRFGTWYQYARANTATGIVRMRGLNIQNALEDGVYVDTFHRMPTGSISSGFYSLHDSIINGANAGIRTFGFSGEVRNTRFTNMRNVAIYTYRGVIDVFESEIGPITEQNLRVDESGAIRLWFELRVRVVWRDDPDIAIEGTTVEIMDNSWTILGVNTIADMEGVLFSNLNSYTVLPEGIYTKNPYIVTADYIGIVKQVNVNIKANTDITISLVDDIRPRLTIEAPGDNHEQRETEVTVKGTIFDKHTEVDKVVISKDGKTWEGATLSEDKFTYEHLVTDLAEGINLITVRGYDTAGNFRELSVTVLVDSTPPNLGVISPTDGMMTNNRILEVVGTTDVGAFVYINDQRVDIQYTLISHDVVLAEGPNAIKIAAVDYLGNINQVVRYVTLDTQAPYIALVNIEDGDSFNSARLTIEGLTETEDVTIKVMDKDVLIVDGKFTTTVTLDEGANTISVYGIDGVGNERTISVKVYLDRSMPWMRLVEPAPEGGLVTQKDFTVAGYVEQDCRVFVNEREVEVSFGYFETIVSANEGEFDLEISALDPAGNEAILVVPLKIDTIAPALEVTFPIDGYVTNSETIEVRGTITGTKGEDMRFFEFRINGVPRLFDYTAGTFAHQVLLEEGVNRISFVAIDEAGNSLRTVRTVMLDSEAPYLSVFVGNTRLDSNWNEPVSLSNFVYVYGFTEIGVVLTINGVSVDVDETTGAFNYTLLLPKPVSGLKISTTDIVAVSTDDAGNSVTITEKVNRIEGAELDEEEGMATYEMLVLLLAVIIFGMAIAGAIGYQRMQEQDLLIESYESAPPPPRYTSNGRVMAPPPARPARGGRARRPSPPEPEVEDEEEV